MLETLFSMIKEEWRMHSAIFGSFLFATFPLIIFIFSFLTCIYTISTLHLDNLLLLFHYIFLVGLSIGALNFRKRSHEQKVWSC